MLLLFMLIASYSLGEGGSEGVSRYKGLNWSTAAAAAEAAAE
jgi:hypothetical protein